VDQHAAIVSRQGHRPAGRCHGALDDQRASRRFPRGSRRSHREVQPGSGSGRGRGPRTSGHDNRGRHFDGSASARMEEEVAALRTGREGRRRLRWRNVLLFLAVIGPGIITANVDNDAGGITTYSLAGAQFGTKLLWTLLPITLSLIVVQEM